MPKVGRKAEPATAAQSLGASGVTKPKPKRRLTKPGLPFRQQRVIRMIKECVKAETEAGGELQPGAKMKLRKAAARAMYIHICTLVVRRIEGCQMLARHAKRETCMDGDWTMMNEVAARA